MGKKIPLLISTLMVAAASFVPSMAWAEGTDDPSLYERTSWTYEEMVAMSNEIQPEIDAACAGDPMCQDMYIDMNKTGDVYRALGHYREHGLTIIAINPHNKTVRVAYNADILSASYPERMHLKNLYMVQVEKGHYGSAVALDYGGDEVEHLNELFVKRTVDNDENWFPADEEMEISIPNFVTPSDSTRDADAKQYQNKIEVFYQMAGSYGGWGDRFDYGDCLDSLEEDMECRIMYRKDTYYYAPVKIAKNVSTDDDIIAIVEPIDAGGERGGYGGGDEIAMNDTNTSAQTDIAPSSDALIASSLKIPDTGAATGNHDEGSVEIAWWLGGIFVIGLGTLAWLFWPACKKSSKKPRK